MYSHKAKLVSEAVELAADAHGSQTDKQGKPYILHCLRVMLQFDDPQLQMVAVCHDVLEDTQFMLPPQWPSTVKTAINVLTREEDETYQGYIEKVNLNFMARAVKLADLRDNLDPDRLKALAQANIPMASLIKRYTEALGVLLAEHPMS